MATDNPNRREKRRHFRGKSRPGRRLEVHYRVVGAAAPGVTAMTSNIGVGGAFIATATPAAIGTPLTIDVHTPHLNEPHSVRAEVRWVSGADDHLGVGMGVKFVDVDVEVMIQLAEYFATLTATA